MENAELDIYIHGSGSTSGEKRQPSTSSQRSAANGRQNTQGTFKRPRTRSQSNGMDILARIKNIVGDKAYQSAYNSVEKDYNIITNGKEVDVEIDDSKAKKAGLKGQFAAAAGIAFAAKSIVDVANLAMDVATINTSNQARKNQIDNMRSGFKQTLSSVGIVGAGVAAGGIIGGVIAIASVLCKMMIDAAKLQAEISRRNQIDISETERKKNRLGYIETGYSR